MGLTTLSGRTDCFPILLVASIVSLYMTGDEMIIKAARKRWLRSELEGTEDMLDSADMKLEKSDMIRNMRRESNSLRGGSLFGKYFSSPNASGHAGTLFMDLPPTLDVHETPPTPPLTPTPGGNMPKI